MDVTLVMCFEAATVTSLTQSQRAYLNPSYATTSFSLSSSHTDDAAAMMPNGTLGLALKHCGVGRVSSSNRRCGYPRRRRASIADPLLGWPRRLPSAR